MLLALPEELLLLALGMLDDPHDLARAEASCRLLKRVAGKVLQPWRETPAGTSGTSTPQAVQVLHHVRALARELAAPVVDDFRYHMAQARCKYLQQHLGMRSRSRTSSAVRRLELHGHGWSFWVYLGRPRGMDMLKAEWATRGISCTMTYQPSVRQWHAYGSVHHGGDADLAKLFAVMVRDVAGGAAMNYERWTVDAA